MDNTSDGRSYTISEAAKLSGLTESTLRYYEKINIINPIKRDESSKQRVYTEQDLNTLMAVSCLNATGMPLSDMRIYLQNGSKNNPKTDDQIKLLSDQKLRLNDEFIHLKIRQKYVDIKIAYWQAITNNNMSEAKRLAEQAHDLATSLKTINR